MISEQMSYQKKRVAVNGYNMSYVEVGQGDPVLFLHGNPTSSYLWRNIIPYCENLGRCIAPDLIGMGDSDKLSPSGPERYRFVEHRDFLDGLLEALGVDNNVTLVIHDWGSALGFDWANRHRESIAGIAYMEAIVRPMTWDQWPESAKPVFEGFRSPAGDDMVLKNNVFIERVLPGSVIRDLSKAEMDHYRLPFINAGEDRRPTLTWPRQIPLEGDPEDVVKIVKDYSEWLCESNLPKLFINADPGAILCGELREFCRNWPNQTEVTVSGTHFIQEDSPDEIGQAIADWINDTVR
jgi:haloalkane dehalogenase